MVNEKVIYLDTNAVLPQSSWNFAKDELYQTHNNSRHLKFNNDLNYKNLDVAKNDLNDILSFFEKNTDHVKITKGVRKQTLFKIDSMLENIANRRSDFVYGAYSILAKNSKDIYSELMNYHTGLLALKKYVQENYVENKYDELFVQLSHFVGVIKYQFEVGKEDHQLDFATDDNLVISAIYDRLKGADDTILISNDSDVSDLLGASLYTFDSLKPVLIHNNAFASLYSVSPKCYNFSGFNDNVPLPIYQKGRELSNKFVRFGEKIPDDETYDYKKKIGKFATFLNRFCDEITDCL